MLLGSTEIDTKYVALLKIAEPQTLQRYLATPYWMPQLTSPESVERRHLRKVLYIIQRKWSGRTTQNIWTWIISEASGLPSPGAAGSPSSTVLYVRRFILYSLHTHCRCLLPDVLYWIRSSYMFILPNRQAIVRFYTICVSKVLPDTKCHTL